MGHRSLSRKQCFGLTLIEVLVALAIISIALTAVIKATTQNIRSTTYLQEKSTAMWVGELVLNEARIGMLTLPSAPDKTRQSTTMLGRQWYWQAGEVATPNKHIRKVEVSVYSHEIDDAASPIITLETYIYHEE